MIETLNIWLESYLTYLWSFFSFLADPKSRLFVGFLLSSLAFAYVLYRRRRTTESFKTFLFPKYIWDHPSAWLDVRYFIFHGMIGGFLVKIMTVGTFAIGINLSIRSDAMDAVTAVTPHGSFLSYVIALTVLIIGLLCADFTAYVLHYLQHKIPTLWQFHKVHHSGEVMHPLSNYREHPIDNMTYKIFIPIMSGIVLGLILNIIGYKPATLDIFGISAVVLLFNLCAYQFRHSHIWLRWPGNWSKIFPSPAHHQVHHSRHPDHLDKNFAFIFPIWDVIFKTYVMPEDNRDVEFGIIEDSSDLNSCINLYWIPFRDLFRLYKNGKKDVAPNPKTLKS